jgi:thiol-disulfide isomerase/thioredoxin
MQLNARRSGLSNAQSAAAMAETEVLLANAAIQFLLRTQPNSVNFNFCFNTVLKSFTKQHLEQALLMVYDHFAKPAAGNCEQSNALAGLKLWENKVGELRGTQIGSTAPDFEIEKGRITLASIESNYTVLLFWATWCSHCLGEVPKIKKVIDDFYAKGNGTMQQLTTVAVSLDTDGKPWQQFIKDNSLYLFLNYSELNGWKSEIAKKFNVYATPTMFVLDKDKKIIAKPETANELKQFLDNAPTAKK